MASPPSADWTAAGVLRGLLSSVLAGALAAAAVLGPGRGAAGPRRAAAVVIQRVVLPLRRLHSGLLGDYVAWLAVGVAGD